MDRRRADTDAARRADSDAARRAVVVDLAALASVAALLVTLQFLAPASLRVRLAVDYAALEPVTLLTAAYVHESRVHLFGNLLGYVMGAVYVYGLCASLRRRAWFRRTFVSLLVVLPVVANAVSFVVIVVRYPGATPVSRGFSAVVGGFGGFLLVVLYATVRSRADAETAAGVLLAVCASVVVALDVRAGADPVVVALGATAALAGLVGAGAFDVDAPVSALRTNRILVAEVLLVGVVLTLLFGSLFPAHPAATERPLAGVSAAAHAAGVVGGAALALLAR